MAIVIVCPTCGQKASAPEETAGQKVQCPHCQAVIVVPGEEKLETAEAEPEREREEYRDEPRRPLRRREEYDEEEEYDDRPSRRRRRGGIGCPYCGSTERPRTTEEISTTGWVLFAVLVMLCWPLCWIPLISCKEQRRYCMDCRGQIY